MRPVLVFDHIPKTAGTTFRRSYLTCALPREERCILTGGEHNAGERERLLAMPPRKRQRLRVIAGHNAESLRPHLTGARFITLIRDPVERAISSYLHARYQEGGDELWAPVRQGDLSLAAFVERYEPPNGQSRLLLGDDYDHLDADQIRDRLNTRYFMIGCTEAFAEFVFVLHATEQLPLCLFNNRLVRHERSSYVPTPAELDVVRARHAVDTQLHRLVQQEFRARLERLSSAHRGLLARYLQALEAFRAETGGDVSQSVRLDDAAREGPFGHFVTSVFDPAGGAPPDRSPGLEAVRGR